MPLRTLTRSLHDVQLPSTGNLLREIMYVTILLAIVAAAGFGFVASTVFSWASNRSAAWNLAFGAALVLATATGMLVAVVIAMRRFSPYVPRGRSR